MPTPPADSSSADERLRQIKLVTDASLAQLSLDDLLVELLDRIRDVLEVDTAVVLLLDESSRRLVATTALGLEVAHRHARLLLDGPFALRIAAEQRPQIIERVDTATNVSPILRDRGVQSLLGVPLIAAGVTVGVLHVGTLRERHFTRADTELLQLAADRVALAAHARLTAAEQEASKALANSLIPSRLPAIEGLELAARYLPAEQGGVGGDWYDVFELPTGEWCFVMGDVAGHGLRAAVVMGRMRSALRAYALEGAGAGEVLERLDRKMQHFEPGAMATVSYAIFDPDLQRLHVSLAGHFAPVVAVPGEPAVLADLASDPPIGAVAGLRRQTSALTVAPGTLLCFYTDGLIERRDSTIDRDLERLRSVVAAIRPEDLCTRVLTELLGSDPTDDDVAVLAVRRVVDEPPPAHQR